MGKQVKFDIFANDKTARVFANIQGRLEKTGAAIGNFAKKALKAAAAVTAIAAALSVKAFASWETGLIDMGKVTDESIDQIRDKILSLDSSYGKATDLIKGYYQTISAGISDPTKALETLKQASKTAQAAHVDQGETIKGLTKIMAGYEGQVEDVSEAADMLFTIEKLGQTSVAELIPVIGSLSKISHDLGVNQDEMGASLAQITQTAGNTDEAATQYMATLTALMKPTTALKTAITNMGYADAQAAIASLGLSGTLKGLKESTSGSSEKMAALFSNVRALKGVSALASNEFENLNLKIEEMGNKTGAAETAWQNYEKTLGAIWDTFVATVEKQGIVIGESLAPTIKTLLNIVTDLLDAYRDIVAVEIEMWMEDLVDAFENGSFSVGDMYAHIEDMITVMRIVGKVIVWVSSTMADLVSWTRKALSWISNLIDKIQSVRESIQSYLPDWMTVDSSAVLAENVAAVTGSYATGTGPAGLPRDGLFYGHKGEIVNTKSESDSMRKNSGINATVNLNVQFMTGDNNAARAVAREVRRLLKSQGLRWGTD